MNHTTDPQAAEPLRIPIGRNITYAVRGMPPVANAYGPGFLVPTEVSLTYRANEDSQLGRFHAYVKGQWLRDGELVPSGQKLPGQHYSGDPSGWPEWLAEELRLHDPDTPSAVVSADRATLLREAAAEIEGIDAHPNATGRHADIYRALAHRFRRQADEADASRVAAEEQPAETPASTAPLAAGLPLVKGRCPACGRASLFLGSGGYVTCAVIECTEPDAASTLLERAAVVEQPDTQTREARLVELRVAYRVQLRDNAAADWKPSHPSLDYEDREDADESAAMGREYFPNREYRVVTRTTTITEQP